MQIDILKKPNEIFINSIIIATDSNNLMKKIRKTKKIIKERFVTIKTLIKLN